MTEDHIVKRLADASEETAAIAVRERWPIAIPPEGDADRDVGDVYRDETRAEPRYRILCEDGEWRQAPDEHARLLSYLMRTQDDARALEDAVLTLAECPGESVGAELARLAVIHAWPLAGQEFETEHLGVGGVVVDHHADGRVRFYVSASDRRVREIPPILARVTDAALRRTAIAALPRGSADAGEDSLIALQLAQVAEHVGWKIRDWWRRPAGNPARLEDAIRLESPAPPAGLLTDRRSARQGEPSVIVVWCSDALAREVPRRLESVARRCRDAQRRRAAARVVEGVAKRSENASIAPDLFEISAPRKTPIQTSPEKVAEQIRRAAELEPDPTPPHSLSPDVAADLAAALARQLRFEPISWPPGEEGRPRRDLVGVVEEADSRYRIWTHDGTPRLVPESHRALAEKLRAGQAERLAETRGRLSEALRDQLDYSVAAFARHEHRLTRRPTGLAERLPDGRVRVWDEHRVPRWVPRGAETLLRSPIRPATLVFDETPRFVVEYSGAGTFRLTHRWSGESSDWTDLGCSARLRIPDGSEAGDYVAFSDFFEGAAPTNVAIRLDTSPTEATGERPR